MEARNEELTLVNNAVPRFDFSELSWGDSLKLTEAQTIISEVSGTEVVQPGQMRDIFNAFMGITEYLAKVCTSIPQSWLTKDAPRNLNFSDPASFGWIKQKNVAKLMQAMNDAQLAEKNE